MNTIKTFTNENLGSVRVLTVGGAPYFVGKDIAQILGYAKPQNALSTHVDEEDKTTALIQGTGSNYKSKAVIINESGMYSLILSSKLPSAKEFKRWVTSEILPSIRKNGGYIEGQEHLSEEDKTRFEEEIQKLRAEVKTLQSRNKWDQEKIKHLSRIIEKDVTGDFDRKKRESWENVNIYDADTEDYEDFQEEMEFFNVSEYSLFEEVKAIINSAKSTHIDKSAAKYIIGEMDRLFAERNTV